MALEGYPGSVDGLSGYLEFLWDQGRYQDATDRLKRFLHPLGWDDWKFRIGEKFSAVFAQKDSAEAEQAFSLLIDAGYDSVTILSLIPAKLNMDGYAELAFKLNSMLSHPGLGHLKHVFSGYIYLKKLKGQKEAFEWLKKNVPPPMLNPSSMFIFGDGDYELLWNLITEPNPNDGADFVWLMRAAAWLKDGRKEEYRSKLTEYYQSHHKTVYERIGRYLLDLEREESIVALIDNDPKRLCEISYYLGLKAQANGDFEKASNWYHVSYSTGLVNNGEYRWAYNQLYEWFSKGRRVKWVL